MTELQRYASNGSFLRQSDVPSPIVLKIARTGEHAFEGKSPQLVVYWQQPGVKPMVCNATNVGLLSTIFGVNDDSQLVGREVEVYVDRTVVLMGKVVGGLRVRLPQQVAQQPPQPGNPPQTPW